MAAQCSDGGHDSNVSHVTRRCLTILRCGPARGFSGPHHGALPIGDQAATGWTIASGRITLITGTWDARITFSTVVPSVARSLERPA